MEQEHPLVVELCSNRAVHLQVKHIHLFSVPSSLFCSFVFRVGMYDSTCSVHLIWHLNNFFVVCFLLLCNVDFQVVSWSCPPPPSAGLSSASALSHCRRGPVRLSRCGNTSLCSDRRTWEARIYRFGRFQCGGHRLGFPEAPLPVAGPQ